jgi:hypothetical protein
MRLFGIFFYYETVEDIFQVNKVEDHFDSFSNQSIYDVYEDVLNLILDQEDQISFQQIIVTESHTETIIQEDLE